MKMLEDKTYKLGLALSGGGFRAGFFILEFCQGWLI